MRGRSYLPFLVVVTLLVGFWSYTQYATRRQWENRTETQYQRAFTDLTNNLGGLETQLAKAAVCNSPHFLRQTLAEIWRHSYAAQEKLGQLPLGMVELTRMKMLLAKVAAFTFRVIDRPAEALRLNASEWRTLQGFRGQARYVSAQLTSMQANIVLNRLRWVDVDRLSGQHLTAAAIARRIGTNKVTKTLVMVENGLKRLPDPGFPESAVLYQAKPKSLTGRKITPAEGRRIATRFVGGPRTDLTARYVGRVKGEIPGLLFSVSDRGGKSAPVMVSLTERNGRVAWMLAERRLGPRRLTLDRATTAALDFVQEKGFQDMSVVSREEFGLVDVITMVPKNGGVLYYPEMTKVQVAMDTGQVVGFEGLGYLTFHDPERRLEPARLTEAEARQRISPHLQIQSVRKAIVIDNDHRELLAYEVASVLKGEHFLVYLDAGDGHEVKIRRVDPNGVEID